MNGEILPWDSQFFGWTVARLTDPKMPLDRLSAVLSDLKAQGVKLVYWARTDALPPSDAQALGARLVDEKTTFAMDLRACSEIAMADVAGVEAYDPAMPSADLIALALQSAQYSRFGMDPDIPSEKAQGLYRIWMERSLRKEIAQEVLVLREGERVVGMVTLGEKSGRGDIGLIAVDAASRGKQHGQKLVRAAQQWFIAKGYGTGQVVTQGGNLPACRLYQKCGYSVDKLEHFYHLWL
jgi:dTDP-4-amino-4,6-dideoxy-D-galactose acyltransferase